MLCCRLWKTPDSRRIFCLEREIMMQKSPQEIIDMIARSEKTTPVKVYVNTTGPVDFGRAAVDRKSVV